MSVRRSPVGAAMVNRPPKPPCWRDFLPDTSSGKRGRTPRSGKSKNGSLHFTDLSQLHRGTGHEPTTGPGSQKTSGHAGTLGVSIPSSLHNQKQGISVHSATLPTSLHRAHDKSHRKHKGKLHRTRSEYSIEKTELPEIENMTVSLGEAKPGREFGLRPGAGKTVFDPRSYIEENARRCERWLEGVKASEPLEDIEFAQGTGVELEIPDEETSGHRSCRGVEPLSDIDSVSVDIPTDKPKSRKKSKSKAPQIAGHGEAEQVKATSAPEEEPEKHVTDDLPGRKRASSVQQGAPPQSDSSHNKVEETQSCSSQSNASINLFVLPEGHGLQPPRSQSMIALHDTCSLIDKIDSTRNLAENSGMLHSEEATDAEKVELHHYDIPGYVLSEKDTLEFSSGLEH